MSTAGKSFPLLRILENGKAFPTAVNNPLTSDVSSSQWIMESEED